MGSAVKLEKRPKRQCSGKMATLTQEEEEESDDNDEDEDYAQVNSHDDSDTDDNSGFKEEAKKRRRNRNDSGVADVSLLAKATLTQQCPTKPPLSDQSKCFVCSFSGCAKVFGRPSRLETHMRTHTGERPFVCEVAGCNKAYARNQHLQRHLQAHEKRNNVKSQTQGRKRPTGSLSVDPTLPKQTKKLLLPPATKLRTETEKDFGDRTKFTCDTCGKQLASLRSLKTHVNLHSDIRFSCDLQSCQQIYPSEKSLKRHKRESHGEGLFTAVPGSRLPGLTSGEESDIPEGLVKVEDANNSTQGGFKVYTCSFCDLQFKKHWQLKTHSYDHTGVLPFKCKDPSCDRAFLYRSHLRRHVKQRHRAHRCLHEDCTMTFSSSLESRRHYQESHVTRTRVCGDCGKTVKAAYFKAHLKTHRETRTVFECTVKGCDRSFLQERNLQQHVKAKHSESPRFQCGSCDKKFLWKSGLVKHMICHEEVEIKEENESSMSGDDWTIPVANRALEWDPETQTFKMGADNPKEEEEKAKSGGKVRRKDFAKGIAGFGLEASKVLVSDYEPLGDADLEEEDYVLKSLQLTNRHQELPTNSKPSEMPFNNQVVKLS